MQNGSFLVKREQLIICIIWACLYSTSDWAIHKSKVTFSVINLLNGLGLYCRFDNILLIRIAVILHSQMKVQREAHSLPIKSDVKQMWPSLLSLSSSPSLSLSLSSCRLDRVEASCNHPASIWNLRKRWRRSIIPKVMLVTAAERRRGKKEEEGEDAAMMGTPLRRKAPAYEWVLPFFLALPL